MSPDRLTVRQQVVEARDLAAEAGDSGNLQCRQIWVRLAAVVEDLKHIEQAPIEVARLTKHLHDQENWAPVRAGSGHPDFEYQTVEIGRKSGEDPEDKLEGDGWEVNGDDHDSWNRGDYTELHCFRRLKNRD